VIYGPTAASASADLAEAAVKVRHHQISPQNIAAV
jgi:hypothetical protein